MMILIGFKSHRKVTNKVLNLLIHTQLLLSCSKSTIETLEKGVKYVQS